MNDYPRWLYSEEQPAGVLVETPMLAELLPAGDWYGNPTRTGEPLISQRHRHLESAVLVTAEEAIPVTVEKIDRRTKAYREQQ